MNVNTSINSSQQGIHHHLIKINHVHIICPFKFCSCVCSICNYICGCPCKCHTINNKTTSKNITTKIPLSNYSRTIYEDELYQNKHNEYNNISPEKISSINSTINQDYLQKRIYNNENYKNKENNNFRYYNSRSLSNINSYGNINENDSHIPEQEKYFRRSYIDDFYNHNKIDNKLYSNPMSERNEKIKNILDGDYMAIRGERSADKNKSLKDGPFLNYTNFNPTKMDLTDNNADDNSLKEKYIYNYQRKKNKHKFRNYLKSMENDKIKENLIHKKKKDKYINLDTYKNKQTQDSEEYNNIKTDKNYFSGLKENNNSFDKNTNQIPNKTNYNYNEEDFFNSNNKINDNLYYKNKNQHNNMNKLNKNNNSYNYGENNKNKAFRNNNYIIDSFHLTIYGFNKSKYILIDKEELNYIKNQIIQKEEEISDYKNKFNSLKKELELCKNEIKKFEQYKMENLTISNNSNSSYRENRINNRYIYRKKSTEEKKNFNERNLHRKKFINKSIKNKNDFQNIEDEKTKEDYNENNKINQKEKQFGLSSKLNIKTDLDIDKDNEYLTAIIQKRKSCDLSDKCVYAISSLTKSKSFLCFDYINKSFSLRDYADFGDFHGNYLLSFENKDQNSANSSIYLVVKYNFFIVTGVNCDMLYVYNSLERTINKLCGLKNNHSNGALLNYSDEIICISGNYNKKVELFNQSKNEWTDLPELKIERSNFATCILKNKYIFCLFGYNFPTKKYLNTIEYLDIENYKNNSWNYLMYKNESLLSLYISGAMGLNYNDEKIIVVGGNNGEKNKPIENFYQIVINNDFEKDDKSYVEEVKRKLKDIDKNKNYIFNKGCHIFSDNNNIYYMAYDNKLRTHLFQISNMAHDIFYYD